jgi:hypothetical protein
MRVALRETVLDMPLKPPPRLMPPDALDSELRDMALASERGFVQFPPPPPPGAPPAAQEPTEDPVDVGRLVTRILICVALAIPVLSIWYILRN